MDRTFHDTDFGWRCAYQLLLDTDSGWTGEENCPSTGSDPDGSEWSSLRFEWELLGFIGSSNFWCHQSKVRIPLLKYSRLRAHNFSGNEIGPFRAIEESTLAHLSPPEVRSDIYAWYSLIGTGGTAFGMMTCGWIVEYLKTLDKWNNVCAYRMMFFGYATIGLIKLALALALSKKCEADKPEAVRRPNLETAPLLGESGIDSASKKSQRSFASMLPSISPESRIVVINLCLLFALDALASGLVPL